MEDKPTLIICKMNGEYHIEMQVSPQNSNTRVHTENYSPLIYKIKTEDNEKKLLKRERKRQRLVKRAVDEVWSDPYHPEFCEKTCAKAYKQAVGILPYDPTNPDCTCSHEEVEESHTCSCYESDSSSDDSSLDLQWEIHFTPPIATASFNDAD